MKTTKKIKARVGPLHYIFAGLSNIIMIAFSISCIFPIVWLLYSTFKTTREFEANVIALPKHLLFDNYVQIFQNSPLGWYLLNTFRNTLVSLVFIVLFGFINGYFFSRFKFKGKGTLRGMYMLGLLVPIQALLIPLYILFNKCHMDDRWFTVVLPDIAFGLPMAILLFESYIGSVPREIEEAALIDGSNFNHTLFTIVLPIVKPILVTVGIITFFNSWNEFSFSLVLLKTQQLFTLPLGLTMFEGVYQSDYPRMMTTMVIAMFPALVIYFAFSKQVISGMMAAALKG
jgi:raffinose/stachyose/melibiose transport system permease protein